MSAMCCVAPSSLMAHPSASLLPNIGATAPYYSTLDSYSAATLSTTPNYYYSHQQDAIRRKRLEDALIETIGPAASTTKVSHRIVRLQQSLYASLPKTATIRQRPHQQQQGQRMMSIDPAKDYSQPLSVDCSIEYDLPRVSRPPPGAEPLLLIAPPPPLRVRAQTTSSSSMQWPPLYVTSSSSCSSRSSSECDLTAKFCNNNNNWMPHLPLLAPPQHQELQQQGQQPVQWSTHRHQFKQQVIQQSKAAHHQQPECDSRCWGQGGGNATNSSCGRWTPYNCQQQPPRHQMMLTLDHLLPFHI